MKILQPGAGWSLEIVCTGRGNGDVGCGAHLLVEEADVFLTARDCMGRDYTEYATICCAACGEWTDITSTDTPSVHPKAMRIARKNGKRK